SIIGGTGFSTIYLNDTGSGSEQNDVVWQNEGRSLVYADGTGDQVVASAAGQTVIGGAGLTSADVLTVALNAGSDQSLVDGGGAYANVFENSMNDTINGGSYYMQVFAAANVTGTINAGDGTVVLFGNGGDSFQVGTQYDSNGAATGVTTFIAGTGNETLYGAGATSNLLVFGGSDTTAVDSLVGGSGNDWFNAGTGSETLVGGGGNNVFLFDSAAAAGGNITIADFTASNNTAAFSGFSASDVANAIASGQEVNGNFVITFGSTNTTVTFDNTTASQLTGHIVTFGS
ncbi:MAG TPA: calcium-binding protein, partial [Acetobacteraceae bacterium]|nr:calcium-binding protein [Acetobacteraceae bacterium]